MKVFFCCICASFLLFFLFILKVHHSPYWISSLFLTCDTSLTFLCFFPLCFGCTSALQTTICYPYRECISYYSFGFSSVIEQTLHYFCIFSVFSQPSQRFFPATFWVFCLFFSCLGPCCCVLCFSSCSVQASPCGGFFSCRAWALGCRLQWLWHAALVAL